MTEQVACPKCGSREIRFRRNRGDWACDDCEHVWGPQPGAAASPAGNAAALPLSSSRSVFISYGRADALEFAERLAADLKQRGGYQVWLDLADIEKGGLFEVRIEQGIRAASVVLAVMTRHSLREESVCRDEVVFALNEGKPVVPLRVDPDPKLKPTLLLARRNWIDFTQNYEESFAALLRYLSGDESASRSPLLPTITGVVPLDFGPEIARFSAGFTGREWLNHELGLWLDNPKGRAFVIIGEPGVGKSAIAAWLSQTRREQVLGIHFCTSRNTRTLNPFEFVACLVAQLCTQLGGYAEAVEGRHPEVRRSTASDAFRELIVEPTRGMPAPAQPLLIIVDSLDEASAQEGETVVDVLVNQAEDLPAWLRIVATTRPEERILQRIRRLSPFELKAERPENLRDVTDYMHGRLRKRGLAVLSPSDAAATVHQLEELADGNFLYARMMLDAIEEGNLSPADLGRMTPGLGEFYSTGFNRAFPDVEAYSRDYLPILKSLAVAVAPIPFVLLQGVTASPPETVNRRLLKLKPYLRTYGQDNATEYALFHNSLRDWLVDQHAAGEYWCDADSGHACLAQSLLEELESTGLACSNDYLLKSLSYHLYQSRNTDQLIAHVNEEFLRRKLSRFGYNVLEDLQWLTRGMLDAGNPALVEHCVTLVEGLLRNVGDDLAEEARQALRLSHTQLLDRSSDIVAPVLPRVPGLDLYVGMLPKGQAGADFFQMVPLADHVALALGDAPGSGLKSAFVARFVGDVWRRLMQVTGPADLGKAVTELDRRLSRHPYFEAIAMTCATIDVGRGILAMANAGQTRPVLYSSRRGVTDRLTFGGRLLNDGAAAAAAPPTWRQRRFELYPGDVLMMFTDGLTEDHQCVGDSYGHRFERLIPQLAGHGARTIGEAILNDWRAHPRQADYADDVSLVVAVLRDYVE
jgi:hypothetical protein